MSDIAHENVMLLHKQRISPAGLESDNIQHLREWRPQMMQDVESMT